MMKQFIILCLMAIAYLSEPIQAIHIMFPENHFYPDSGVFTRTAVITNKEDKLYAGEIFITQSNIDGNGVETRVSQDAFFVYPEQILLRKGESKLITIVYQSQKVVPQEVAYRIHFNEILLDDATGETKKVETVPSGPKTSVDLKFKVNKIKFLYVTPTGASAYVRLLSAKEFVDPIAKERFVEVIIENAGKKHAKLLGMSLSLSNKAFPGSAVRLSEEDLKISHVLFSGNTRRHLIPWPKQLKVGAINASAAFNVIQ